VEDFENSRKPQAKNTVTLWYTTKVSSLWETQRARKFPLNVLPTARQLHHFHGKSLAKKINK